MNETPLSFGELWILYLGIHRDNSPLPIGIIHDNDLTRERGYNANLNMPANGLSLRSQVQILTKLRNTGLIDIFSLESPHDDDSIRLPFPLPAPDQFEEVIQQEIDAYFRTFEGDQSGQPLIFFQLTTQGIEAWESYAQPDWGRFRGDWRGQLYDGVGETVWSQSAQFESFAVEVLTVHALEPCGESVIHWDSKFVAAHEPWEPMPGKKLPSGVTVYVRVIELGSFPSTFDDHEKLKPERDEHRRRWDFIERWYKVYLEKHPDCPPRRRSMI